MNLIKVGAAVLNQIPLDWAGNQQRILSAIRDARAQGVSVRSSGPSARMNVCALSKRDEIL